MQCNVQGKGSENIANYAHAHLHFCNIGNIHTMRDSQAALVELCLPSTATSATADDSRWLSRLEASGWQKHAALILAGATYAAEKLHLEVGWVEPVLP